jgi:Secretion system C-terminal sorting domain
MNKISFFLIVLASLQLGPVQYSYTQEWQWAVSCGKSSGDDYGTIASDNIGNTYLTGYYNGIGIFGNDTLIPTTFGGTNVPVMFCKIDPTGNFQWVKSIMGADPSFAKGMVAINKAVNYIYFYGGYNGDINIGGNYFQSNTEQIFISKFDPAGNCIWAKHAGGTLGNWVDNASVDNSGNIFIAGGVYDTATFGSITIVPGNYLAKYDADGNCQWARNICSSLNIDGITTNGTQIILVGETHVTTPFYFDSFLLDPSSLGLILASFDVDGNTQWAKMDGNGETSWVTNPGFDNNNNFYISGRGGNFNFGEDTLINNSNGSQFFLVKFNNLGNSIWARETSGANNVTPRQLTVGTNNNIYVTGSMAFNNVLNATTYFGNFPATIGAPPMVVDMFVAAYDDIGNCVGVKNTPTDIAQNNPSGGTSVAVDSSGNCIVAGQFINSTIFDSFHITSEGARDIYIAKCGAFYGSGIDEKKPENVLIIYANPNDGICSITIPEEFRHEQHLTLSIYNNQGKLIQQPPVVIVGELVTLNISVEAKGIYTAMLSNGKKNYTGKIIFK